MCGVLLFFAVCNRVVLLSACCLCVCLFAWFLVFVVVFGIRFVQSCVDVCLPTQVNKHVTAHTDATSITMLYKVLDGPCDRSFGIHVAKMAQFPAEVNVRSFLGCPFQFASSF